MLQATNHSRSSIVVRLRGHRQINFQQTTPVALCATSPPPLRSTQTTGIRGVMCEGKWQSNPLGGGEL